MLGLSLERAEETSNEFSETSKIMSFSFNINLCKNSLFLSSNFLVLSSANCPNTLFIAASGLLGSY